MDQHQLRLAHLKITVVVLGLTSWLFSGFILETRPEEEADVDPLQSLVRLPASLPAQLPETVADVFEKQAKAPEPVKMETLKMPCWDSVKPEPQELASRWVRLVGRTCQTDINGEAITVKNLANGYTATVFSTAPLALTTDFIPLESGSNEIVIHIDQGEGASVENKITLVR